jgi:hypothetical protein
MVFYALKLDIINTIVQIILFSFYFSSIIYCAIWIDVVDSEILSSFINKMISVCPNEIVYCILETKNYSDDEFKERRFEFLNT